MYKLEVLPQHLFSLKAKPKYPINHIYKISILLYHSNGWYKKRVYLKEDINALAQNYVN